MLENPGGALCSEAAVRNTVCRKNSLGAAPRSLLEPEGSCARVRMRVTGLSQRSLLGCYDTGQLCSAVPEL